MPISRLDSAVTRQFLAAAKPGITRFTACKPKPRIPNRIIKKLARDFPLCSSVPSVVLIQRRAYFVVVAIDVGADPTEAAIEPFVNPPVLESIVNALISLEFSLAT